MKKRICRNHSPTFKSKVALAANKGDKTISELAQHFDVHTNRSADRERGSGHTPKLSHATGNKTHAQSRHGRTR